jgi:ssDNA-binding replication factor A large subunit
VRSYEKKGKSGKIGSFIIADDTGNTRVVLWDTNHIDLIEKGEIKEGDVVELGNASVRDSEIHVSGFSEIKKSSEVMENVKTERTYDERSLESVRHGQRVRVRGFILQVFEPRFFEVCPECGKRVVKEAEGSVCEKHGKVVSSKRALLNIVIDDGTENIRAVLFSEALESLGFSMQELENPEIFVQKKEDLIGKEIYLDGVIRENNFFNNLEFTIEKIEEIDIDSLISKLEKT